jgi:oligopeptide transport system ATP-binding protein
MAAEMYPESGELVSLVPEADRAVTVRNLQKYFPVRAGVLQRTVADIRAVDDVSFAIPEGDTFGLVGESGCGKTTAGKSILRIEEPTAGDVIVDGTNVTELSRSELRSFRRKMQMVFQDPTSSLNPRKRVRSIITAPMEIHDIGTEASRRERVAELLEIVGLPQEYMYTYPNALSGGQKQRVGIARAVSLNPDFLVLDEPTSALDVSVQARIVDLFEDLQESFDLTYLFISHDLSLIRNVADWIGVMYLGKIVEIGRAEAVFREPQHPYTQALLSAIATLDPEDEAVKPERIRAEGEVPDPRNKPTGCDFRTRCPKEFGPCSTDDPPYYRVGPEHFATCYLHE